VQEGLERSSVQELEFVEAIQDLSSLLAGQLVDEEK
jgi:hypothetical protein